MPRQQNSENCKRSNGMGSTQTTLTRFHPSATNADFIQSSIDQLSTLKAGSVEPRTQTRRDVGFFETQYIEQHDVKTSYDHDNSTANLASEELKIKPCRLAGHVNTYRLRSLVLSTIDAEDYHSGRERFGRQFNQQGLRL